MDNSIHTHPYLLDAPDFVEIVDAHSYGIENPSEDTTVLITNQGISIPPGGSRSFLPVSGKRYNQRLDIDFKGGTSPACTIFITVDKDVA